MTPKKVPMRKCLGCCTQREKRELVRIVRSPEGDFSIDATGRQNGRGAYICPDPECLRLLKKSKRLNKAFSQAVPDSIYDALAKELERE